ncbi:Aldo/keto reductase [Dendrothele bispora CBS 962.96]|uniref:Aldo/keto reductase n=1 Tax=Dendrothele bispora (strain CBS 962.96) TaxID=1314807 RepID=A0A4V4HEE4_DENBC|nr:Aldo/keto reductase [Dendrothele bispora CBS 962.96]THU90735.1 Aldo/keto reductase [Dendrothele bispora CBS 962.96]
MTGPTRVPLLFGTMTLGHTGKNGVRIADPKQCQEVLDAFFDHGHKELDTARVYAEGTTEQLLAQLDLRDATIDTKVMPVRPGDHAPAALRSTFMTSLRALNRSKVRVLYLHAPDRNVPFEETLSEINNLYREGLFEIFGLSNYASWEVAEIVGICKANGWVIPRIYQVMYNAITREMEAELLPCCRKFGIRVVIYNPLAGGLFSGKITSGDDLVTAGGRFDNSSKLGQMYRARYLNHSHFEAVEHLRSVAAKHNLRMTEIALRWCQHHSLLTPEDGVILGASSKEQLEQNCIDSAKGPLPEEVTMALDKAHALAKPHAPLYWR